MIEEKIYQKFSNDRNPALNIVTEICVADGRRTVVKRAYSEESIEHIKRMYTWSNKLKPRFENTGIKLSPCRLEEDAVYFEYIEGITLENILDECIVDDNREKFFRLLEEYIEKVKKIYDPEPFHVSEDFEKVFGRVNLEDGMPATRELDIDLIFPNLLVKSEGWTAIDYEWTFDFPIPISFLLYRAAFFYLHNSPKRVDFCGHQLMEALGISEPWQVQFREMERHFQTNYVYGNHASLLAMYEEFGKECMTFDDYLQVRENFSGAQLKIDALENSTSWKLTKPMRAVVGKMRRG